MKLGHRQADYGRFPLPVSHSRRSRFLVPRSTALLVTVTVFALGLVLGALLFSRALVAGSRPHADLNAVLDAK